MAAGKIVKCDCCGTETLAEVKSNKLVIIDKRHGKRHLVVLSLQEIMSMMEDMTKSLNTA